ncbi:TIGR04438 family Trp-rich protein [Roseateles violae]|uniref:TIGR04438 family Trp-rich protein n=1 Tax=Roseateles violae TaxID=3058042 RepID=A0ABT8DQG9_9BURK|nr:TIGR04438 family Trp-rich protein [Pelomonas sp. PFR6]MDN3920243.1 TIGR04438 family Trp-rich protein [Pelomonas sp. PFR6]
MWFVLIGVLLGGLKLAGVAPVADWSWLAVLAPFGLAVVWWAWADQSGYTRKKAMDRMEARKAARRERALEALGKGEQQRNKR